MEFPHHFGIGYAKTGHIELVYIGSVQMFILLRFKAHAITRDLTEENASV